MPKYIKKETATGAIRSFFSTAAAVDYPVGLIAHDETLVVFAWTEGQTDSGRFYMPGDELIERPRLFRQDEISVPADGEAKVSAELVKDTVVRHNGEERTAGKRQPFQFSSAVPGEFVFEIDPPFPYQRQIVRITAHAV
jgi:hypothetical protein